MVNEVLAALDCPEVAAPVYIDGTFGAGGHTSAILQHNPNAVVHGFDRDHRVASHVAQIRANHGLERLHFYNYRFSLMDQVLAQHGVTRVNGILLDLGVSSMQLDQGERGFSFQHDGPLRMTMGCNERDAEQIVNGYSLDELQQLLIAYGDESPRDAERIAKEIIITRRRQKITTTAQLSEVVIRALGRIRRGKIHVATLTFQALRIAVNDELDELDQGLRAAAAMLLPGAALAVISFQGLEDRVIKQVCRELKAEGGYLLDNRGKVIVPSSAEVRGNPRSRSAKMRILRRVNCV